MQARPPMTSLELFHIRELLEKSSGPWLTPVHSPLAKSNGQAVSPPGPGEEIQVPRVAVMTPNGNPLGFLLPLMAANGPASAQGITVAAVLRASVPVSQKILVISRDEVAKEETARALDDWMLLSQVHGIIATLCDEVERLWSQGPPMQGILTPE